MERDSRTTKEDSSDDPERPEFERAVEELEMTLQEAIVRSRKKCLAIC